MSFPYFRPSKEIYEPIYSESYYRKNKLKKIKNIMEKNKLKETINQLIIDPYFGIYNRNGLEYILSQHERNDLDIYLVDFDNVKSMNESIGYKKVNEIFKETFNELKENFIIGRAFSGDEIFFCTDNFIFDINDIKEVCNKHNLNFYSIKEIYHPYYDNLIDILNNMIDKLHK